MKRKALLAALTLAGLAGTPTWAGFPFPDGTYKGKSVCRDQAGAESTGAVSIVFSGDTMRTESHDDQGDHVSIKNAAFAPDGTFELTGPDVVAGRGRCTPSSVCHYDVTLRVPYNGSSSDVPGEDTFLLIGDTLYLKGSVTFKYPGGELKSVCLQTFAAPAAAK